MDPQKLKGFVRHTFSNSAGLYRKKLRHGVGVLNNHCCTGSILEALVQPKKRKWFSSFVRIFFCLEICDTTAAHVLHLRHLFYVVSEVSQTKNFLDLFRLLIFLEKVKDSNQTTMIVFEDLLFLSLFFLLGRSFLHVCLDGCKLEKKVLQNFLKGHSYVFFPAFLVLLYQLLFFGYSKVFFFFILNPKP